jgi:hypothetical protein
MGCRRPSGAGGMSGLHLSESYSDVETSPETGSEGGMEGEGVGGKALNPS